MRHLIILLLSVTLFWSASSGRAEDKAAAPAKYEYAVVKWDGPDRLFYNLPDKFELVYLSKVGVQVPREAQAEEWCLAFAANKLAKEGWEAVNLNSRRILMRRAK